MSLFWISRIADYKSTNVIIAERSLTLDGVDDQSNNIKLNLHINEVNNSSPRSAYYYNGLGIQLPTVMEHTSYYVLCEKFYP
jgi:hypothetical protein